MVVFEQYAGPGGGKSVASAALFVGLKNVGVRAQLVGEAATELILSGSKQPCFDNQYFVGGYQWERLLRLSRHDCKVAITDSPLIQGQLYSKHLPYYEEQLALIRKLEAQFTTYKTFVHRVTPYDTFGRNQTAQEAAALDKIAYDLGAPYWLEINGDHDGQQKLVFAARSLFDIQLACS